MKGVSLDIWELIGIAGGTYRGTLYLALAGIPRLGEESRLKRIRKALIRETKGVNETRWILDGKSHREDDFPAVIYLSGSQFWYKAGNFHRETGPAIIESKGTEYWFNNGKYKP